MPRKPRTANYIDPETGEFDVTGYDNDMEAYENASEQHSERLRDDAINDFDDDDFDY